MNEVQAVKLGHLLRRARRRQGRSLRTVADLAGIDYLWLSRVERGLFTKPAPERLTKVAEVLSIPPERLDRVTKGHVSSSLPGVRTYFRAKYDLAPGEIDKIERTIQQIQRSRERRQNL